MSFFKLSFSLRFWRGDLFFCRNDRQVIVVWIHDRQHITDKSSRKENMAGPSQWYELYSASVFLDVRSFVDIDHLLKNFNNLSREETSTTRRWRDTNSVMWCDGARFGFSSQITTHNFLESFRVHALYLASTITCCFFPSSEKKNNIIAIEEVVPRRPFRWSFIQNKVPHVLSYHNNLESICHRLAGAFWRR